MKKIKMVKGNWLSIGVALLMIQLMALWAIDISVSGTIASIQTGKEFVNTNGFYQVSPMITYHIALYILIFTALFFMMLVIHAFVDANVYSKVKNDKVAE